MQIKIRKGYDIPLRGALTDDAACTHVQSAVVAIVPDDFTGFIPKMDVHAGDTVHPGSPLAHHKTDPELRLTSPVEGRVKAIVRGDRRKVLRIEIERTAEAPEAPVTFNFDKTDSASCAKALANSGLMAMMNRRPYDIVADSRMRYRDIYVSAFDSAPLAHNQHFTPDRQNRIAAGVSMLRTLTDGNIYIARRPGSLEDVEGAVMVDVHGPHPASLPSTVINATAPLCKGQNVLTLDIDTLERVGRLYTMGTVDYSTTVAVVGPMVETPRLVTCTIGTAIKDITGELKADRHLRIISGNVLTGKAVDADGYLRRPYRQVTVMAEGDETSEFMGWATFSPKNLSMNPSFPGKWLGKLFSPDARIKGGRRAIIQSGEYDRLIPLDIMAEYLIKAINSRDIDNMERLGIYEVAPEDFALAEFADSSKLPLQNIVRQGLDYLRGELEV